MPESESRPLGAWRTFWASWPTLFGLHLTALALGFLVAGPVLTLFVSRGVAASGQAALSDTDILGFLLCPGGFFLSLGVLALWITFHLLAYSAQLVAVRVTMRGDDISIPAAIAATLPRFPALFLLTLRFLGHIGALTLPFLLATAGVVWMQLRQNDINYYLEARPPEFVWAVYLALTITVIGAVVILRAATGWFLALPMVLFTSTRPGNARRVSVIHTTGHRAKIFFVLMLWILLPAVIIGAIHIPWPRLALEAARLLQHRVGVLAVALGTLLGLGAILSGLVTFLATALLANYHVRFFLRRETKLGEIALPTSDERTRLPWQLVVALGCVVLAVATWLSYRTLNSIRPEDRALVVAHRGASALAPENTLAAIQAALDTGADRIEIDVQQTAAGELRVVHDRDLMRVARQPVTVRDASPALLADLDVGSWFHKKFADQRVPTLSQVLEACGKKGQLIVELKYYGGEVGLEKQVIETVEAAGMADRVSLMSLNSDALLKIRELRPDWRIGLLSTAAIGNLTLLDVDFLALNTAAARSDLIREAHQAGLDVYVWTVDEPLAISSMLSRGVDGVITNDPTVVRKILRDRADLNPGERLLVDLAARLDLPPPSLDP